MSLRRQLIIALMVLLAVVGIAGGLASYFVARQEPDDFLDDRLVQVAHFVGDSDRPVSDAGAPSLDPEDAIIVQVWRADGTPVRLSNPEITIARRTVSGFADVEASGEAWRSYAIIEADRTVQVSERMLVRNELATNSALRSAYPLVGLIPLSWLVLGALIGRILRPLSDLANAVRRRDPGSAEALPTGKLPAEVLPVVHAVNDLLERQHALLESRERFISDAAHQLRTPLTALSIQADNLANARTAESRDAMMADIRQGIVRMSALASQLLTLARADQPRYAAATESNLAEIVKTVVSDAFPLAENMAADLGFDRLEDVMITASPDDIGMIVANLVDNALRYGGPKAHIDVAAFEDGDHAVVQVTDSGPGIPAAELSLVFERFFRSDEQAPGGSGLGLSIARALALRNGATLSLHNRPTGSGLVARLEIPLANISA